jgi:hypothetical protein
MEGTMNNRIEELQAFAVAEGIELPYPPEIIAAMEDAGNVVDFITGDILIGEADTPYWWAWTPYGEAVAHLLAVTS